jgi:hypothetical protein
MLADNIFSSNCEGRKGREEEWKESGGGGKEGKP